MIVMFVAGSWETRAEFRDGEGGRWGPRSQSVFVLFNLRLTQTCPLFSPVCGSSSPSCGGAEFVFQPVYALALFLLLRLQSSLYPSPGSTPLLCFLITLSHTLLCVGVHCWAGVPLLASDWLAEGCALCIVRENKGGRGGDSSRLGSGESGDGVRGCFCFEMVGFETSRGASLSVCRWHARQVGPDRRPLSPLAEEAALLLSLCSRRAAWSCASLVSSPAARAARAPKCSPALAL